jgi:hydrogenase-4 component F
MGVTPMFTVDIDAKDVAPTPVGALLSGGLMNVGFVAILRFYQVFANSGIQEWMNNVLLVTGFASVLFGAVYIVKVKNFKRMFAYSSVEHGGLVLIALASGKEGYFAMIFHLIMHSFVKSSLFLQMGQVYRTYESVTYDKIGSYFKFNPVGGSVMLVGLLCVTAMPPSGLFVSEFFIFKGLFYRGHWLFAAVILVLLTIIMYYLSANIFKLLFSKNSLDAKPKEIMNPLESLSQLIMLLTVLYFGINPPEEITVFINQVVSVIPNVN